jgi:hypothetical protein
MFNRREGDSKVKKFDAGLAKIRHAGSLKSIQQSRGFLIPISLQNADLN